MRGGKGFDLVERVGGSGDFSLLFLAFWASELVSLRALALGSDEHAAANMAAAASEKRLRKRDGQRNHPFEGSQTTVLHEIHA